jgi:hypothetical protein
MQVTDLNLSEVKELKFLPDLFSREPKTTHINKLKISIKKHGVLRDVVVAKLPFIGDGLFIIDGQSLVKSCLDLSIELSAKIIDIDSMKHLVELMSTVNSASKNWSLSNYIDAWATLKLPDYVYLKKVQEVSGIKGSALLYLYTNFDRYANMNELVREGKLIINKERGDRLLQAFNMYVDCGFYRSSNSVIGLVRFMGKIGVEGFNETLCEVIKTNLSIYSQKLSLMELAFYLNIHTKNKF